MGAWERSRGDLLHRLLYTDINSYLIELLMKQDQMSMAASIESRVPFLDHPLVEFTARIPAQRRDQRDGGKFILKEAVADLLPEDDCLPQEDGISHALGLLAGRPATGGDRATAVGAAKPARGLFRREAIQRIFAEHRAGHRDHGNRIWRLLNLELWQRVFLDGEVDPAVSASANQRGGPISDAPILHGPNIQMLRKAKLATLGLLRSAGAFELVANSKWRRERLLILCYHGISLEDEHQWRPALYMHGGIARTATGSAASHALFRAAAGRGSQPACARAIFRRAVSRSLSMMARMTSTSRPTRC